MKMTSKILSFLMAATMFSTTAFAADVKFDDKVEYVTGENIEVSVYVTNDAITSIDGFTYAGISYDSDALTFVEGKAGVVTASEFADEGGIVYWEYNGTAAVAISDLSQPLFSLVFSVDEANLDADTAVWISEGAIGANSSSIQMDLTDVSVKVTKKSTDPVPGTVGEKDGYTTVVDDDKATRFVVTDTKASIAATAASVLKVTYDGDTQSANLYKLLGVENAENAGNITIGSLTIKMILSADVQDVADIADYSFVIE